MSDRLLEVRNLTMQFGGVTALSEVNLHVSEGEIAALIVPNGAGKTTVFNVTTGYYTPTSGEVLLMNESIVGLKPHKIARKGLARTFQNVRLFGDMTALENVMTGADSRNKVGLIGSMFGTAQSRRDEESAHLKAAELLNFMGISHRGGQLARNLPYGDQRRLEIARALALDPKVLLLDEPVAGVNPVLREKIKERIRKFKEKGETILLIEHDMNFVMDLVDYIYVLDYGKVIAQGKPEEIRHNKKVLEAYLGE